MGSSVRAGRNSGNAVKELKKALQEKEKETAILHQISESISCNLDLDEVLKQIIEIVVQVSHGDACLLYLLDGRRAHLPRAEVGREPAHIRGQVPDHPFPPALGEGLHLVAHNLPRR